jgi:transposase
MADENGMEKLGVQERVNRDKLEKAASQGCPMCGEQCQKIGSLLRCPVHGTEPFEETDGG